MTGYVVDASVVGPLIIPDEANETLEDLRLILDGGGVMVPQHWRLEVANMARMAVRRGRVTDDILRRALEALDRFQIPVDPETGEQAWRRTLSIATQHDLTVYDAAYLELAIRTDRHLVTTDRALAKAAVAERVEVVSR